MDYSTNTILIVSSAILFTAFIRSGIGVGGLGRVLLRYVFYGLVVAFFVSFVYLPSFTVNAQGLERWGILLGVLLALTLGVWLFFQINRRLSSPMDDTGQTTSSSQLLLIGAGLTGLAYLLAFRFVDVPKSDIDVVAIAQDMLSIVGVIAVFAVPIIVLGLFLTTKGDEPHGPYRGKFADHKALHPLLVNPNKDVPGDALLVGMINQGTPERPKMSFLARRPGFGEQKELGHALFTYPNRKGKGLQLTTQALFWRHSMLFIDPKAEFYELLANHRQAMGQNVFILDPSEPSQSNQYDPFADLGDSAEALRSAAKIILEPPPNSREPPYFAQRATNGLVAALRAAKLANRPGLAYLYEVKRRGLPHFIRTLAQINDDIVIDNLTDFIGRHPSESSAEKLAADERLLTIWSTLNTRTADLLQPGVRAITSGCDFRARDLVLNDKPATLFLTFRESEIEATKAFLRLTILGLITDLIRVGDTRADDIKHKLLLAFDEAGRIPIPRLYDLVSTVSSRGMSVLIYVQDLSQLEANYGRDYAAGIRGNCDTQVFYRPTETSTAKYVTDRAGKTSIPYLNVVTDGWGEVKSESQVWKDRELITVSEFMQFPETMTLSFVGNLPPLVAGRLDYRLLPDEVASINRLNQQPIKLMRPSQPAVRYAPASPPQTAATTPQASGKGEHEKASRKRKDAASNDAAPPQGAPAASQLADEPAAPERTPKKKRARTRKPKDSAKGPINSQGSGNVEIGNNPPKPTFSSGHEAALAAFSEEGGDVDHIRPCVAAVTGGGMPYEVYTNGKAEVAVCEVRETGHFFIASFEELGLESKDRRAQA